MDNAMLQVRMLGGFSVTFGDRCIHDESNRSRKVQLLLAYILYNHSRVIPQSELIDTFWNKDKGAVNPANALKTTLHRVRALLEQLSPQLGRDMIINKNGGYSWNPEITICLDIEAFDLLCRSSTEDDSDGGLRRLLKAAELYRGDFMGKMSDQAWTLPVSVYYHNMYLQAVGRTLPLLERENRLEDAEELCRAALAIDPYQEELHQNLMRTLLAQNKHQQAAAAYDEMSKLFLEAFGVMPNQDSRALYREALRTSTERTIPAGVLHEHLREPGIIAGALVCDYDFFKILYQAEARLVARSGSAIHIALFTLSGKDGGTIQRRSLDLAMDNFQELIRSSLRKGDIVSRCSPSQFIVMLPQANFENSCMVCQRLLWAFFRRYPHSPVHIDYTVQPLEPATGSQAPVPPVG